MKDAKNTSIGSVFPSISVLNEEYRSVSYSPIKNKNKYVLIDFWFSYCQPCLKEFPKYIQIYKNYRQTGFEMIGISVDKKEDRDNWMKLINAKQLNWIQYLDEDGKIANELSITEFPTNFLLDQNGVIIKKNITPEELEMFLSSRKKIN